MNNSLNDISTKIKTLKEEFKHSKKNFEKEIQALESKKEDLKSYDLKEQLEKEGSKNLKKVLDLHTQIKKILQSIPKFIKIGKTLDSFNGNGYCNDLEGDFLYIQSLLRKAEVSMNAITIPGNLKFHNWHKDINNKRVKIGNTTGKNYKKEHLKNHNAVNEDNSAIDQLHKLALFCKETIMELLECDVSCDYDHACLTRYNGLTNLIKNLKLIENGQDIRAHIDSNPHGSY